MGLPGKPQFRFIAKPVIAGFAVILYCAIGAASIVAWMPIAMSRTQDATAPRGCASVSTGPGTHMCASYKLANQSVGFLVFISLSQWVANQVFLSVLYRAYE